MCQIIVLTNEQIKQTMKENFIKGGVISENENELFETYFNNLPDIEKVRNLIVSHELKEMAIARSN